MRVHVVTVNSVSGKYLIIIGISIVYNFGNSITTHSSLSASVALSPSQFVETQTLKHMPKSGSNWQDTTFEDTFIKSQVN